jgi:hypothetical protein
VSEGDWRWIAPGYFTEPSGTLGVMELGRHLPFPVKRVFWLFGMPDQTVRRGDHAHADLQQVVYCARGSCLIELIARDGTTETHELREGGPALYLNGPVWRTMTRFSADAAFIALCDREYAFDTVIRERAEFFGA